jgi:NADPH:quinone reductase-like Zn-dependent oxidoreductase
MERQVYRMPKAGSISNLKLKKETIEAPKSTEAQISVKAIGLNFADVFAMHGLYSATPKGSFIPGLEFSGEIVSVGAEVSAFKVGDRVMGVTKFGGYVDRINHDIRYLTLLDDDWSYEEGAAYIVQGLTAYYALVSLGNIQKGSTVLIHSGAGGVGVMSNRIAKQFGAHTIGTIGTASKQEFLKQEGFDECIIRDADFETKLEQAIAGRELKLIVETIGGKIFKTGYKLMAPEGRMVVVGVSQYASPGAMPNYLKLIWQFLKRPKIDPQDMIQDNKSVMAFNLIWLYDKAELMENILNEMKKMDLGKPHVGSTYSFDKLHDAIHFFQSGKSTGKVVVTVDH